MLLGLFYGNLGDYEDASLEAMASSVGPLDSYISVTHPNLVRTPGYIYRHPEDMNFGAWITEIDPSVAEA